MDLLSSLLFKIGGAVVVLGLLQGITGVLLQQFYHPAPNANAAYDTVLFITNTWPWGFVRSSHYWGAQLLIVLVVLARLATSTASFLLQLTSCGDHLAGPLYLVHVLLGVALRAEVLAKALVVCTLLYTHSANAAKFLSEHPSSFLTWHQPVIYILCPFTHKK